MAVRKKNVPRPLSYFGGKNPTRPLNRWIQTLLPAPTWKTTYVEPFCGMMGVLLGRERSGIEIVNDLNGNIVNWWWSVREHPRELARRIWMTPFSREVFGQCVEILMTGNADRLTRAWAQHVILWQNVMAAPVAKVTSNWAPLLTPKQTRSGGLNMRHTEQQIQVLSDRVRDVQLENRDALDLIERTISFDHALLYCDPPYAGACIDGYGLDTLDRPRMAELLMAHKGRVAVSGYAGNWDCLSGWNRHEFRLKITVGPQPDGQRVRDRTEVLWTNFAPPKDLFTG